MYFITTKRMLEVCFSVHPNIQYRTFLLAAMARKRSLWAIIRPQWPANATGRRLPG